jgi:hypothetical protein
LNEPGQVLLVCYPVHLSQPHALREVEWEIVGCGTTTSVTPLVRRRLCGVGKERGFGECAKNTQHRFDPRVGCVRKKQEDQQLVLGFVYNVLAWLCVEWRPRRNRYSGPLVWSLQ